MEYAVVWEITIEADNPKEAAEKALDIQRDEDSIATYFQVNDENDTYYVDLFEDTIRKADL